MSEQTKLSSFQTESILRKWNIFGCHAQPENTADTHCTPIPCLWRWMWQEMQAVFFYQAKLQYHSEINKHCTLCLFNKPWLQRKWPVHFHQGVRYSVRTCIFFNMFAFVIHNQYFSCSALLWQTKHKSSSNKCTISKRNSNQNTVN